MYCTSWRKRLPTAISQLAEGTNFSTSLHRCRSPRCGQVGRKKWMWAHRSCTSLIEEHTLMVVHCSAFFAVVLPLRPNLFGSTCSQSSLQEYSAVSSAPPAITVLTERRLH